MRVRSIRNIPESEISKDNGASAEPTAPRPTSALTEAEAAHYIGMSAAWLKKSRTKRFREVIDAPPFVRAGAKRVVYRIEDLDAWQERHLEHVGPLGDASSGLDGESAA
jgi:predicted DNA-binding transcriptional regulator AlpA